MGLDQLQLLRSQHKMARLLLVAALCLASVKAAVIPVEEIVDNLQSFLTAPEESGLRLKRSTGEWDKEFDLSSMGILFQLKYNNPANPFEGGRAHVKVPGARFIRNAPFDDMDLDIEFNGGSAIDGLFDMKGDYKFIQKFMFLADRPQEGSFVLYRKMEGGMWKTKVTVDNNNMMPKPFLDISVESDRKTKLHVLFNFQDEMTVTAWHTPGKELKIESNLPEFQSLKITSAGPTKKFEFNGKEVATVDFDSSSKKASHTMHLPSGKDLTIDLAWPKMTPAASDLEFGVTITPDRKVVTKFGWKMAGVKKVYLDVVGNNPWIGDYKLSRQGEFEPVSPSVYKIKWTGHGETTNGFLRRISPVETNVVTSLNMNNMKVDAIVWKSFAGKKYGFTLTNDKFLLLAGDH